MSTLPGIGVALCVPLVLAAFGVHVALIELSDVDALSWGLILLGLLIISLLMYLTLRWIVQLLRQAWGRSIDPASIRKADAFWKCPKCQEQIEQKFIVCWNCGTNQQGEADAAFEPAVVFHPECEACGYILLGTSEDRCPECGAAFDRANVDTPRPLHDKS